MAAKPVAIFISDSWGNGAGNLSQVPPSEFSRWTGTTHPTTYPVDISIPDVEILTPRLPYGDTRTATISVLHYVCTFNNQTSNVAVSDTLTFSGGGLATLVYLVDAGTTGTIGFTMTAGNVPTNGETFSNGTGGDGQVSSTPTVRGFTLNPSGLTGIVADSRLFLKVSASASRGEFRTVDVYSTPILIALTAFSVTPSVGDTVEVWTDTRTIDASTSTVVTKSSTSAVFSAADVGRWVVIGDGLGAGQARRITAQTSTTITVSPAWLLNPLATNFIRVLTGANSATSISAISSTTSVLSPLRIFKDIKQTTYSSGIDYPNYYGQALVSPAVHASNDAVNHIPETLWWMRQHFEGKLYCVNVAGSGATMAPYNIGSTLAGLTFSWTRDIESLDWRPSSTNGLYSVLIAELQALKALMALNGDTPDVRVVFTCIGTNDALDDDKAESFGVGMKTLRETLRNYIASNGMSTLGADQIDWVMSTGASSRVYIGDVENAIVELADDDMHSGYVRSGAFEMDDGVHPNETGALQLGKAFYDTWVAVQAAAAAASAPDANRPTLADFRTKVKRRLEGSTASNAFTATRIDTAINDSLREVYLTLGSNAWFLRITETATISSVYPNTVTLKRPVRDLIRIESASSPGTSLKWKGLSLQDNGKTQITLFNSAAGSYVIHYMTLPSELENDGDRPPLPVEYCELVVMLASKRLAESAGNSAMGAYYNSEVGRLWSFVKRDCLRRDRFRQESMTAIPSFDEWSTIDGDYWS